MADGIDRQQFLSQKKRRYMAQLLESFEELVEPLIDMSQAENETKVREFKGTVRRKLNALAVDAIDVMNTDDAGMVRNGAAVALQERIHPETPTGVATA